MHDTPRSLCHQCNKRRATVGLLCAQCAEDVDKNPINYHHMRNNRHERLTQVMYRRRGVEYLGRGALAPQTSGHIADEWED